MPGAFAHINPEEGKLLYFLSLLQIYRTYEMDTITYMNLPECT